MYRCCIIPIRTGSKRGAFFIYTGLYTSESPGIGTKGKPLFSIDHTSNHTHKTIFLRRTLTEKPYPIGTVVSYARKGAYKKSDSFKSRERKRMQISESEAKAKIKERINKTLTKL